MGILNQVVFSLGLSMKSMGPLDFGDRGSETSLNILTLFYVIAWI